MGLTPNSDMLGNSQENLDTWYKYDDAGGSHVVPYPCFHSCGDFRQRSLVGIWRHNLKVCSWNARGLFCHDPVKYKVKLKYVRQLLHKYDVVLIQETHDNIAKHDLLDELLRDIAVVYYNPGTSSQGGTLVAIRVGFKSKYDNIDSPIVHIGRVQHIRICGRQGNLHIFNIHWNRLPLLRKE